MKKLIFVGDSTVQDYPDDGPKRGWGQVLPLFFGTGVECQNAAAGGRSTKTFIGEGRWQKVLEEKPDVIFIQFGHNDSHAKDRPESTDASTDYRAFLGQYVSEGKAIGAKIILVTPMHRRYFNSQGKLKDNLRPYAETMKAVAKETGTPCIDLHQLSRELLEKLGEDGSEALFCCPTDRTHFSKKGATAMARFIAEAAAKEIPDLKPYLKDSREWPE
ncbi:MAG: rhamnogalacturonan acetylesterase [Lentisphaeria bacterium]